MKPLKDLATLSLVFCAALACFAATPAQAQLPTVVPDQIFDLGDLTDPFDPNITIPAPNVNFGSAVAADGDYAIICGLTPALQGRAYLYVNGFFGWTRELRIDETVPLADYQGFGASVSMQGGTAAILQRWSTTKAIHLFSEDAGYAWEDSIDTSRWPVANVKAIAVDGDTLLLGDETALDPRTNVKAGGVAVFHRTAAGWQLQTQLFPPTPQVTPTYFGTSVAISDDRIIVGAHTVSANRGECHIFEKREGVWKHVAKLTENERGLQNFFGKSVAISGDTALVSSPGRVISDVKGCVSAFRRSSTGVWKFEGLLPAPVPEPNTAIAAPKYFGSKISLSGALAAIGSFANNPHAPQLDRSYLFQRRGDRWIQLAPIEAPDLSAPGASVAVSGRRFFAGAPMENTNGGSRSGRVRTYLVNSGLGVLDGSSVSAPEITTDAGADIFLGDIVVGKKVTRRFTVQNLSGGLMENLFVAGDGVEGEELIFPEITELPIGSAITITLNVTAPTAGLWSTRVVVDGFSPDYVNATINIFANVLEEAVPPVINGQSVAQLVYQDGPVEFLVDASGTETLRYQWLKNGSAVPSQTGRQVLIRSVQNSDAGLYKAKVTNAAGSVTSVDIPVAVYERKPDTNVRVNDGKPLTLIAPVKGPGVTFRWLFNNATLTEGPLYSGTATGELKIKAAAPALAGTYTVILNPGLNQIVPQKWIVSVLTSPSITNAADFLAQLSVGRAVTTRITTTPQGTRFYFKNLPPGLVGSPSYGTITGKPTQPGSYTVGIIAANLAGESAQRFFNATVTGVDSRLVGQFRGLIGRHASNANLGGSVDCTTTVTGKCTGVLLIGKRRLPFATTLFETQDGMAYFADIDASTKTVDEKYELRFTKATGRLSGSVATDSGLASIISGWIKPWSVNQPSALWTNFCTSALLPQAADLNKIPAGNSFFSLRTDISGNAQWAGRMADGSVTTMSTAMSPTQLNLDNTDAVEMPVFLLLSDGTASVLGNVRLNQSDFSKPNYHSLTGTVDWFKQAATASSKTRSYKGGITRHDLSVEGGGYAAASAGLPVLGLPPTPLNAAFSVSGAGIEAAAQASLISAPFTLTGSTKALMPLPNATKRALNIDRARGTFSGTFTLTDPDVLYPNIKVVRTVNYHGVLLANGLGSGFFLLPEKPNPFVAPVTTVGTSPILSGLIELGSSAP